MTAPIAEVIERNVDPGVGLFEIVDDPELAGTSEWNAEAGPIQVGPGWIGLLTAGRYYQPEIVLRAWLREPPRAPSAPDVVITKQHEATVVSLPRHQVEVWGGEVTPGTVKLRLPDRFGDQYWVRVTVDELVDHPGQSIDEYVEPRAVRGETVIGIERFTVDFWPASPEAKSSSASGSPDSILGPGGDDEWVDPIENPGQLVDQLRVAISDPNDRVLEVVDDPDRIEVDYRLDAVEAVTVLPGRVRYVLPAQRPVEVVLSVFSGQPDDTECRHSRNVLGDFRATFVTRDIHLWSLTEHVGPVGLPQPWTNFHLRLVEHGRVLEIEVWPAAG